MGREKWNKSRGKTHSNWDYYCKWGRGEYSDNPSELQGRTRRAYMEQRMVRPDAEDFGDFILSIAWAAKRSGKIFPYSWGDSEKEIMAFQLVLL